MCDIITHDFTCDPNLIGMDAINATGRNNYVTDSVVATMPRAISPSGRIHFFRVRKILEPGQPAVEATKHGFGLADPHTLAAFNAANPEFADIYTNATEWVDKNGKVCCEIFDNQNLARCVFVNQDGDEWDDWVWFAGVSE